MAGELEKNLRTIEAKIDFELEQNKDLQKPLLLAVSKKQPIEKITALSKMGVQAFGENYLQEALDKKRRLKNVNLQWHFIGQLQSRKIKNIVGEFDLIHTLFRLTELNKIQEVAEDRGLKQDVLIQVNIAEEATKQGIFPGQLLGFIENVKLAPNVRLRGLMFFPPLCQSEEESLHWFGQAAQTFEDIKKGCDADFSVLSMGTSQDYHLALRMGATLIRVGESLMGSRL